MQPPSGILPSGSIVAICISALLSSSAPLLAITHHHNDARIAYDGTLFPKHQTEHVELNRFPDSLLESSPGFNADRARVPSCVVIRFTTNSPTITAHFGTIPTAKNLKMPQYAVYRNGSIEAGDYEEFKFPGDTENPVFTIVSEEPGESVTYEILLPALNATCFKGLELEPGYDLESNPVDERPVYVAIGDSITMSAGHQSKSYETYTWKLGRERGMKIYNLAVSGAKTAAEFGALFPGLEPEFITVLFGINDWNTANDTELFLTKYQGLIDNIRADHPDTPIFCITLVAIGDVVNPVGSEGVTVNDYRNVIIDFVNGRRLNGDEAIYLIEGHSFTQPEDLADGFHFHRDGTTQFAENLRAIIDSVLVDDQYNQVSRLPENTYSDWAARHNVNAAVDRKEEDIEGDGLGNFTEYVLGEDPRDARRSSKYPSARFDSAGGTFTFVYPRRRNAAALGLKYEVEASDTLRTGDWVLGRGWESGTDVLNAEFERVSHSLSFEGRGFARLKVTSSQIN